MLSFIIKNKENITRSIKKKGFGSYKYYSRSSFVKGYQWVQSSLIKCIKVSSIFPESNMHTKIDVMFCDCFIFLLTF